MNRAGKSVAALLLVVVCAFLGSCNKKVAMNRQASSVEGFLYSDSTRAGGGGGGNRSRVSEPSASLESGRSFAQLQSQAASAPIPQDRKIIRTASLNMLVNDVAKTVDAITSTVNGMGGYVEKAERRQTGITSASVVVRVPAERLDEAMASVKKMATRVDTDTVQAQDVTREFIDLDARLRNTQAEEARYLEIMKRASTVKDTLEVAGKLSDVRGRIEQMQGEMNYLKTQISMSRLEISVHAESEATVMGLHWRPLREAKAAAIDMLQGLADWMDDVIAFIINLPLILVWCVSILVLLVIAWRIIRFVWRKVFPNASIIPAWLRRRKPEAPSA